MPCREVAQARQWRQKRRVERRAIDASAMPAVHVEVELVTGIEEEEVGLKTQN